MERIVAVEQWRNRRRPPVSRAETSGRPASYPRVPICTIAVESKEAEPRGEFLTLLSGCSILGPTTRRPKGAWTGGLAQGFWVFGLFGFPYAHLQQRASGIQGNFMILETS
jgi:hypothetical protein